MGRITQIHIRKRTRRKSKVKTASNRKHKHTNQKRCPSCGRFM